VDAAIFMHPKVWEASGHVEGFNDPMIDDKQSKKRYRADMLIEQHILKLREKGKQRRPMNSSSFSIPPARVKGFAKISNRSLWMKRSSARLRGVRLDRCASVQPDVQN
jgi:glycyl-tRNA synthetase (class II)